MNPKYQVSESDNRFRLPALGAGLHTAVRDLPLYSCCRVHF